MQRLILLFISTYALQVLLVTDVHLMTELQEVISASESEVWLVSDSGEEIVEMLAVEQPTSVLDMTNNALIWSRLQAFSPSKTVLYRYIDGEIGKFGFFSPIIGNAIAELLSFFSWSTFNLIYTSTPLSTQAAVYLQDRFIGADPVLIPADSPFSLLERLAGRLLQPRGKRFFVLILPTELANGLLQAGMKQGLYYAGTVWILSSLANAVRPEVMTSLGCGLMHFSSFDTMPTNSINRIKLAIEEIANNTVDSQAQTLFSSSGPLYKTIGLCSATGCRVQGPLVFPGCTSQVPQSPYAHLLLTLPTQVYTPDEESFPPHIQGALYAIEDINANSAILPNYKIWYQSYYYGILDFNKTAAVENARKLRFHFGSALSAAFSTAAVVGLFQLLASANTTVPIIGSEVMIPLLSNMTKFPFFVRTIVSDAYMAYFYVEWLKRTGWRRCSVLYRKNIWSEGFYQMFEDGAKRSGMEIANGEQLRVLPDDEEGMKQVSEELVGVKARVVLLICIEKEIIMRSIISMYNAGLRKGDVVIVAVGWLVDNVWSFFPVDYMYIFEELLSGSIMAFPAAYVGAEGRKLQAKFRKKMGADPPLGTCLFYDSMMLVGKALDFIINSGQEAENPQTVINAIRGTKFHGCSGLVSIDPSSNDRSQMTILIRNLRYWSDNNTWELANVLLYNPTSSTLITKIGTFVWPDGSSQVPTDTVVFDIDCPFQSRELRNTTTGRVIMQCLCYFVVAVVGMTTWMIWRKWWRMEFPRLVKKEEISPSDVLVLASLVIEFFQHLAMGPDSSSLIQSLPRLSESLTLDLQSFFSMTQGGFWLLLDFVFGVCAFWLFALVMLHYDLWRYTERICMFPTMKTVTDLLMPLIGSVCFLPIISVLLEVFLCDQATGNNITDAVLTKDCYQHCWVFPHSLYVSLAVLALIIYVPPAVFYRPLWQHLQSNLHVMTSPAYLMEKTIFQLILIVLNKTLKRVWPLVHSIAFSAAILTFTGITFRTSPFNYSRPNLWHSILLLGNCCLSGLYCLYSTGLMTRVLSVYVLLGLWGALVAVGVAVQCVRCPSMLYRKKGQDITVLFQFQLTNRVSASTITPRLNKVKDLDTVF